MKLYPTLTVMKNSEGHEQYAILWNDMILYFSLETEAIKAWQQLVAIVDQTERIEPYK